MALLSSVDAVVCASALEQGLGTNPVSAQGARPGCRFCFQNKIVVGKVFIHSVLHTIAIKSCGGLIQGMVLDQVRDRNG